MWQYRFSGQIRSLCLLIGLLGLCHMAIGQGSFRQIRKAADAAFTQKKYQVAAELYEEGLMMSPGHSKSQKNLGISYFYTKNFEKSSGHLRAHLANTKRIHPDVYFYMGKSLHRQHLFKEATGWYKTFLKNAKRNDPRKQGVVDELKRCYHGHLAKFTPSMAVIENLGDKVNSGSGEIKPILSPNYPDRVYFSSDREILNRTGNISRGIYNMYSTEIQRGEWAPAEVFVPVYQSSQHEILQDINPDGSALLFFRGDLPTSGYLLADSFDIKSDVPLATGLPIATEFGDRDVFQFSDSLVLFSSRRSGGAGGFDLYYSLKNKNDIWSTPENMGRNVNSEFDELYPFLAANGRVLYFSSNRPESIGGYDVFSSEFDDDTQQWSTPVNLGIPVNSACDDLGFRGDEVGNRIFLSSDRPGGLGGYDLYIGYTRETLSGQNMLSFPPSFADVASYKAELEKLARQRGSDRLSESTEDPKMGSTLKLEPLFVRSTDVQISTPNKQILDRIADWMKIHTESKLVLVSHLDKGGNLTFQLFTSVQQGEHIATYLNARGIDKKRIHITGLGSQYPIAKAIIDNKPNESAHFLNKRIEPVIQSNANIQYEFPEISPFMRDEAGYDYKKRQRDITYRVQFVSLRQMYAGDLMEKFKDCSIEKKGESNVMQYCVGMFKRMSEAIKTRELVIAEGFNDAFIVAYLNGSRLEKSEITPEMVEKYPDLKNFVRFTD